MTPDQTEPNLHSNPGLSDSKVSVCHTSGYSITSVTCQAPVRAALLQESRRALCFRTSISDLALAIHCK